MNISKEDIEYQKELDEKAELEIEDMKKTQLEEKKLHDKQMLEDRIDLLKKKQGIVQEDNDKASEEKTKEKLKGLKWVENFWYHYNAYIIMITVAVGIGTFLLINALTTPKADLNVLCLTSQADLDKQCSLQKFVESYCDDYNKDDEVYIGMIRIDDSTDMANTTKLMTELQASNSMLVIMDQKSEKIIDPSLYLVDITKMYPDNKNVTKNGFLLSNPEIAKEIDWANMPSDIYIGIRNPDTIFGDSKEKVTKRYNEALDALKKIIEKNSD